MTGHAHIDLAWLWPYEETRRKLQAHASTTALALMERSPDFIFNQSTAHYLRPGRGRRSGNFRRDQGARRRGAMGADRRHVGRARHQHADAAKAWRGNALRPALFRARVRRAPSRVLAARLLRLLAGAAAIAAPGAASTVFFTIKVTWSETNKFPHDLFWWEGLDGSRVLAPHVRQSARRLQRRSAAGLRRADLGQFPRQGAPSRDAARGRLRRRRRRR